MAVNTEIVNGEHWETCKFQLERLPDRFRLRGTDDDGDPFVLTFSDLWASELAMELENR